MAAPPVHPAELEGLNQSSQKVLKPITTIFTLFLGLNPLSKKRNGCTYVSPIVPTVVLGMYFAKSLPMFFGMSPTGGLKNFETLMWVITLTWLLAAVLIQGVSIHWFRSGLVQKFCNTVNQISNGRVVHERRHWLYGMQTVFYAIFFILMLLGNFFTLVVNPSHAPMMFEFFGIPYVYIVPHIWYLLMLPCVPCLAVVMIQIVTYELDQYHKDLSQPNQLDPPTIQILTVRFGNISASIECLNKMLSIYLCLKLLITLPVVIALIFAMIIAMADGVMDTLSTWLFIVTFAGELFFLTWLPATLYHKIEEIPGLMTHCANYWNPLDLQHNVMLLALYNQSKECSTIDMLGFGRLTRGFILTVGLEKYNYKLFKKNPSLLQVVSVVFTYLTMLVQMSEDEPLVTGDLALYLNKTLIKEN